MAVAPVSRPVAVIGDAQWNPLHELSNFDNLEMVHRAGDVGAGKLEVSAPSAKDRKYLVEGATIQIISGQSVRQSGWLREVGEEQRSGRSTSTPSWVDENALLAAAQVFPNPAYIGGQEDTQSGQGPAEYDMFVGYASSMVLGMVADNVGPGAIPWRRAPGVTMGADPQAGLYVSNPVAFRWSNLLDSCRSVALGNGIGWEWTAAGRSHAFTPYQARDLSSTVVFSKALNTLGDGHHSRLAPTATRMIALGPGEGTGRVAFLVQSDESRRQEQSWGRAFVDVHDSTTTIRDPAADAAQKAAEDAAKAASKDRESAEKNVATAQSDVSDAQQSWSDKSTKLATDPTPTDAQKTAVLAAQDKINAKSADLVAARAALLAAQSAEVATAAVAVTATANAAASTLTLTVAAVRDEALRKLAEKGETVEAQYEVIDDIWRFGRDYRLFDLVAVQVEGFSEPFVHPVREVTETWSVSAGHKTKPLIGDYQASSGAGATVKTRDLQRTLALIQTRR